LRGINNLVSASGTLSSTRPDPLLAEIDLALVEFLHPAGFQLKLQTNSHDVVEAAREVWGAYCNEFQCESIRLRIIVQPVGDAASDPVFRAQGSQFAVVAGRDNFGFFDAASFSGFCVISAATASDHALLRWSFLESAVYLLLTQRYIVPVHAGCVAKHGTGVLLCGPSGAGKSTLAYACARAGWTYLSDDATLLLVGSEGRAAVGRPHQIRFREDAPVLFPELAGSGVALRPNGRLAMEVPTRTLPKVRTATRCVIEHLVFLDRHSDAERELQPLDGTTAVESLIRDMPSYGPEINALQEATLRQLKSASAWRMRYGNTEEAIGLLSGLVSR
jgi:hypothetical protein